MGMYTNRLIHQKSPYLLQHAHDPVDWRPWGEEAFQEARLQDKPIFLSVGYASCHWCHVMQRESFQDVEIAALLNRHFVPVKVDREERPDVDRVYMTFVQAATGAGGWPMSVFLTPELEPFFGGTYFPPDDRYGRPSFKWVLGRIAEAWRTERERVRQSAGAVIEQLRRYSEFQAARLEAAETVLDAGFNAFRRIFDPVHGGFGGAPKFPRPAVLAFLLRYWDLTGNPEALTMTAATLRAMARGGLRDQLGGGFHRYSVDERWCVPHFEKMLYDQAQLAACYMEAWQVTGDEFCAAVARDTLDYLLRDMRHPEGGFYSAEGADSPVDAADPERTEEGGYYLWSASEIRSEVPEPAATWFCAHYGVNGHERSILHEAQTLEQTARQAGRPLEELRAALAEARARLLVRRAQRPRPLRDDKILTAWNGLTISAFARAFQAFAEPRYWEAARQAADFLQSRMYASGTLLRRYRDGEAAIPAFLEDYAFLVQGLLDLYETGFETRDLELALRLTEQQRTLFEDSERGGFFNSARDPSLVLRLKDDHDGAEPSGNSVSAMNLLRLAAMTGQPDLHQAAERTLAAFRRQMVAAPESLPLMLASVAYHRSGLRQIVIAGESDEPQTRSLAAVVHRLFLPRKVLLLLDRDRSERLAVSLGHLTREVPASGATAYVCEDFTCQLPVSDPGELARLLKRPPGA